MLCIPAHRSPTTDADGHGSRSRWPGYRLAISPGFVICVAAMMLVEDGKPTWR